MPSLLLLLAASAVATVSTTTGPDLAVCANMSVHLALGEPGKMVVTWSSDNLTQLSFGMDSNRLAATNTSNLTLTNPDGNTTRSISIHHATLRGLVWGTSYVYSIHTTSSDSCCTFNFTYGGPHTYTGRPLTLAVLGDLGVKEQSGANYTLHRLLQHAARNEIDAVLHAGDFAYDLRERGGRQGAEFLSDMQPVASSVPYMTCPGNHERDCPGANPESCVDVPYTNYRSWFNMPSNVPRLFWSADIGPVHLVSLNTDLYLLNRPPTELLLPQLEWLRADLKAADVNRQKVPWVVAMGHEMMYSTHDTSHVAQAKLIREGIVNVSAGLEDVFHDHLVDMYFAGHEHVYEAFDRTYRSAFHPNGTAHVIVGNGGDREFPYRNGTRIARFAFSMPEYERTRSTSPAGYGLLRLNATMLSWTQYNARSGKPIDEYAVHRPRSPHGGEN